MERIEKTFADELGKRLGKQPVTEYRFTDLRRWRFDVALPDIKLAIEIHGRNHGRAKQLCSDCEKINCATELGWTVLCYPASKVLTKCRLPLIIDQIERIVCGVSDETAGSGVLTQ